jgi:hypothetical protein
MTRNTLRLAELRGLSPAEASGRVKRFLQSSQPLNGEVQELEAEINAYETRYEMSSTVMRQRVRESRIEHTADICRWQMLLEMRDRVSKAR